MALGEQKSAAPAENCSDGQQKVSFAVLTVSDRCYEKKATDISGEKLCSMLKSGLIGCQSDVVFSDIVPDERICIQEKVKYCCDELKVNVLLTTGGTGLAPRDVTPESVEPLLDRKVDGLSTVILMEGLKKTPFAALSRGVAGIRGQTLVITLPGSIKGCEEGLTAIAPVLLHAVDLINDVKANVASTHGETESVRPNAAKFNVADPPLKSKVRVNESEETRVRVSPYPCIEMSEVNTKLEMLKILPKQSEAVGTENAVGLVLAEDVVADENIPQAPTSMKDGYAVGPAKKSGEAEWKIIGASLPGKPFNGELKAGEAVKVSTGSAVPDSTESVVPVEETSVASDCLTVKNPITPRADIREIGSDCSIGQTVLVRGAILAEPEVGLLASIGKASVTVYRKPVVAVMSTGDELYEPWTEMGPHGVRDSNRVVIKALLNSWGYEIIDLGIVKDEPDLLLTALTKGFQKADVVITSGGMSMGERDLLKDILIQDFNANIHFGRIAMKPGKPTGFAIMSGSNGVKHWFGLPGNPASAYVTAHLVVLPALRILSGWTENYFLATLEVRLGENLKGDPERTEFVRGVLNFDQKMVYTKGASQQRSSNILGCTGSNCLIEVPIGGLNRNNYRHAITVQVHLLK